MLTTAAKIITSALRLTGAVAADEQLSASDLADGLDRLNDLMESLTLDGLLVYSQASETFPLTSGQSRYTMGPLGDFDTQRPNIITGAELIDSANYAWALDLVTFDAYNRIANKSQIGAHPSVLFVDESWPQANLYFWEVPTSGLQVHLTSEKVLAGFPTAASEVDLPPGYSRMLKYALAVDGFAEYGDAMPREVRAIAEEAKKVLKIRNFRNQTMQCDMPLVGRRNWIYSNVT